MAQDLSAKKSNYVGRLQSAVGDMLDTRLRLIGLREEYAALGFGAAGSADALADADLSAFPHLTVALIDSAIAALDAMNNLLTTGAPPPLSALQAMRP